MATPENICPVCGAVCAKTDKVCPVCDADLTEDSFRRCPNGHVVHGGDKFCPWCGELVGKGQKQTQLLGRPAPTGTGSEPRRTVRLSSTSQEGGRRTVIKRPGESGKAEKPKVVGFLVSYTLDPAGYFYALREGRQNIGSGQGVNMRLDDPELSSEHAVILYRNGRFIFEDRLSSNGSFVNGQEIIGQIELHQGDSIVMGSHTFILAIVSQGE